MSGVTHAMLVRAARLWLLKDHRVVATEMIVTAIGEVPDVIGFKGCGTSTLVECKASRADFLSDARKVFRRTDQGLGTYRYYMVTPGIITGDNDIPKWWGAVEYRPSGHARGYFIKKILDAPCRLFCTDQTPSLLAERRFLVSLAGRALDAVSLVKSLTIGLGEDGDENDHRG